MMTLEQLRTAEQAGSIDTVLVAFTDMQGRLQGKRYAASHFLDAVVGHAAEACNYLLAVDVEMNTVAGYAMSSWERGYGDFELVPDMTTLRRVPWHEGTALVLCDLRWADGSPVPASPRQVLRGQLDRLAERGLAADVGTELEFQLFADSFDDAWRKGYHDLAPANLYNVDYSLLGTARVEPLLRRIRNAMAGAGLVVESAKGECNLGQHEIAFRYADALTTCDNHSIYKTGAKEIADQAGMALTSWPSTRARGQLLPPPHLAARHRGAPAGQRLRSRRAARVLPAVRALHRRPLACLRELTYLFAPNINSYKRFAEGVLRATAVAWGHGQPHLLAAGGRARGGLRVENRLPGGDMNPYLGVPR
jgi:glutamine synthetase